MGLLRDTRSVDYGSVCFSSFCMFCCRCRIWCLSRCTLAVWFSWISKHNWADPRLIHPHALTPFSTSPLNPRLFMVFQIRRRNPTHHPQPKQHPNSTTNSELSVKSEASTLPKTSHSTPPSQAFTQFLNPPPKTQST